MILSSISCASSRSMTGRGVSCSFDSLVPVFCCHSALLAGVSGASSDSLHCMRKLDHEMAFSVHLQSGVEYTRAASCFPSRYGVARYSGGAPSSPCLCHASPTLPLPMQITSSTLHQAYRSRFIYRTEYPFKLLSVAYSLTLHIRSLCFSVAWTHRNILRH